VQVFEGDGIDPTRRLEAQHVEHPVIFEVNEFVERKLVKTTHLNGSNAPAETIQRVADIIHSHMPVPSGTLVHAGAKIGRGIKNTLAEWNKAGWSETRSQPAVSHTFQFTPISDDVEVMIVVTMSW
jgi:hypothetical protein